MNADERRSEMVFLLVADLRLSVFSCAQTKVFGSIQRFEEISSAEDAAHNPL
jgi:hypothetical protein